MVAQLIKTQVEKIEYRERTLFWSLFSVFVFFVFLYGYFVNGAIMNAVHKENLQSKISALNTNVNALEFQYLGMKNGITMDLALSRGYVQVPESHFALLSQNHSLSVNEN